MSAQPRDDINVLFADDHQPFRRAIRRILEGAPGIHVVAEAENGEGALARLQECHPDVAILDLDMPFKDGLQVAAAIRDRRLPIKSILLTAHKSEALVRRALEAGISGYVLKDDAVSEILECVRAVHAGRQYFSPQLRQKPVVLPIPK